MTDAASSKVKPWLAVMTATAAVSLSIPPLRSVIEQSMAWHMVFQMPLLVLSGWLAVRALPPHNLPKCWDSFNRFGLSGLMASQIIVAYWMLPLAIDRAVVMPAADALKLITLFISGALLADAFTRAPLVLQLFFMGYWVPMTAWLGIYLATTDLRLCNSYSLESQVQTGWGLLALGAALGVAWGCNALSQIQPPKVT